MDVPVLPGPYIRFTASSAALPELAMYSQRTRQREAVFESVTQQDGAAIGVRAFRDADARVGGHGGVLDNTAE